MWKFFKALFFGMTFTIAALFSGSEAEHKANIKAHKDEELKDRGCEKDD